jgi:ubiquinone/menaquinone biosynthesis C-methylase UbiE
MPRTGTNPKIETQTFYDRIADVHNIALKLNGYRASVAKYLASLNLDIKPDAVVLDAGSGTGILTSAFHDAGFRFGRIFSLDLSLKSLGVAREEMAVFPERLLRTDWVQGNVLKMPFADDTFDIILMCGVLEYTPLDDGLREVARVLKPGAPLVLLPVKPSIVGTVLELLYDFKIHPLGRIREAAAKYFQIVGNFEFPVTEPIAWSKTGFLLEKK